MSQIISASELRDLLAASQKQGKRVIAPVVAETGESFFREIGDASAFVPNPGLRPANSIKEFFFPKTETICSFKRHENDVDVVDSPLYEQEQVIIGSRPCEAAALPILDHVFSWDYQDRFYQRRREKTTVVTFACVASDESCFCSDVGGGPDNPSGSDAMLFNLGDETYEVRVLTEKGQTLFAGVTRESEKSGQACAAPVKTFDAAAVSDWVKSHFSDPFWNEIALSCVGCGVCTYACPTCHCFDLIDQGSFMAGKRVKNWDSCQFAMFTKHASGHNPRPDQGSRQRQRLLHKFSIYPEKFGTLLCTGCGNCSRMCGVSLGIKPVLLEIERRRQE
ncbi:MAG: 4Fe-4S dicluster domain-containing protein [Planctomycetia bacterium]|nr:4Fe-4S dicluster domain-containing protein [Planctomycetia bacterium]